MEGKCETNCPRSNRPKLFAEEKVFMNAKTSEIDQQGKSQDLSCYATESTLYSVFHSSNSLCPWNLHGNVSRGALWAPYCLAGMLFSKGNNIMRRDI